MTESLIESSPPRDVGATLEAVCAGRGLNSLAGKLTEMRLWLAGDLAAVEAAVGSVARDERTLAHRSVRHLLEQEGKRLRPICVALAARVGAGFGDAAREYAIAVELVHNATLLHDDVVDLGDRRRGADTARVLYGNAASIFGGDWLLVEALGRIQRAGQPEVLEKMLSVIQEMVVAEALQLARRGRVRTTAADYFEIANGKTASLFGWALFAGARAGQVEASADRALEQFGRKLGTAFQLVDDVLDIAGDPQETGKALLVDLREGKMTYPLLLAMERDPWLAPVLEELCAADDVVLEPSLAARVARSLGASHIAEDSLELATRLCQEAVRVLSVLPAGPARSCLESVALATPRRRK